MHRPALLTALLLPALGAAQSPQGLPQLHRDGPWVKDATGRTVLLRGMSYSGLEFGNFIGMPDGPEEADFDQMASWGVNVIRIPFAWAYLEPAPNVFDDTYLADQVDVVVGWAEQRGMVVILEMHQFLWSPCVGGIGVPGWTCEGSGYRPGVMGAFQAQHDFWAGALAPDGRPLLDHMLDAWGRVIARYRTHPAVTGFEPLNEPLDWEAIPTFEHDALYPFYRRFVRLVRGLGATQMVVLEPPVTRNIGIPAQPESVWDGNLLYAPHLYTSTGGLDTLGYDGDRDAVDADYALAEAEANAQGAALWVGELGGNADAFLHETEQFYAHSLEEQDERLLGGAGWAYFPGGNGFSVVEASGAEKGYLVSAIARPYPAATAGTPVRLAFHPQSRVFTYAFTEDASAAGPTVIFVPLARHYPTGVRVAVTPGDVAVLDAPGSRVLVHGDPANAVHEVWLAPGP